MWGNMSGSANIILYSACTIGMRSKYAWIIDKGMSPISDGGNLYQNDRRANIVPQSNWRRSG